MSTTRQQWRELTIDLTNARADELWLVPGDRITIVSASVSTARIQFRLNHTSHGLATFKDPMSIGGLSFDRLYITNTAQAGVTITVLITGQPGDDEQGLLDAAVEVEL